MHLALSPSMLVARRAARQVGMVGTTLAMSSFGTRPQRNFARSGASAKAPPWRDAQMGRRDADRPRSLPEAAQGRARPEVSTGRARQKGATSKVRQEPTTPSRPTWCDAQKKYVNALPSAKEAPRQTATGSRPMESRPKAKGGGASSFARGSHHEHAPAKAALHRGTQQHRNAPASRWPRQQKGASPSKWDAPRRHQQGRKSSDGAAARPERRESGRGGAVSAGTLDFYAKLPPKFRLNPTARCSLMDYAKVGTWASCGLPGPLVEGVGKAFGIATPNATQLATIPAILAPSSCVLCAAETGSGKTLAYLLPIMSKIKAEEQCAAQEQHDAQEKHAAQGVPHNRNASLEGPGGERTDGDGLPSAGHRAGHEGSPRAIICVPSNELVDQVTGVAKALSHHVKVRVAKLSGCEDIDAQRRRCSDKPIDILVGTPGQLLNGQNDLIISLDRVKHIVIDEGDTLLSDDFGQDVKTLIEASSPVLDTVVVASATIPMSLTMLLTDMFPRIQKIGSPRLHTANDRVDVRFHDVRLPGNVKLETLEGLLKRHNAKRTLVFFNSFQSAQKVHQMVCEDESIMASLEAPPSLLHGHMPERQRQVIVKRFMEGTIRYLFCTDLASRGLDTLAVDHVIMFDFARNTVDFIHRIGRTGRAAGRRGLVSCLVSSRDHGLAKVIKESIKSGTPLSDASAK